MKVWPILCEKREIPMDWSSTWLIQIFTCTVIYISPLFFPHLSSLGHALKGCSWMQYARSVDVDFINFVTFIWTKNIFIVFL